ncbi:DUF202 domain-containing protein [Sphingopyxis sp. JAI108]|uniref:DUF202 domain-containing protein n=1 Tax=Sphingopyxis sp. JAI108 TaxID=2723060 RepID=UPI0015C8A6E3|nr:DUF202 domain-containing protein [Sphingopyxis sp. JAI108]NYF32616.1 putative membrane protein [Sphingopyxis sp. JAI108]
MSAEERTDLAQNRTELAEDRTVLAHERSFAGWVRTGMAAVGLGLGFNALFRTMEPSWMPKAIATSFLLIAIYIFVSAEQRARTIIASLEPHNVTVLRPMRIRLLAWALAAATTSLVAALWLAAPE